MIWKDLRKIKSKLHLTFCMLKKKYIYISCLCFKTTQIVKNKYSFNDSKWRMMALSCTKKLSALLKGITSKGKGDIYCLDRLHSFRTKNKLESHKKVCQNKDFCNIRILINFCFN